MVIGTGVLGNGPDAKKCRMSQLFCSLLKCIWPFLHFILWHGFKKMGDVLAVLLTFEIVQKTHPSKKWEMYWLFWPFLHFILWHGFKKWGMYWLFCSLLQKMPDVLAIWVSVAPRRSQALPGAPRRPQAVPGVPRRSQTLPCAPRRSQAFPGACTAALRNVSVSVFVPSMFASALQ